MNVSVRRILILLGSILSSTMHGAAVNIQPNIQQTKDRGLVQEVQRDQPWQEFFPVLTGGVLGAATVRKMTRVDNKNTAQGSFSGKIDISLPLVIIKPDHQKTGQNVWTKPGAGVDSKPFSGSLEQGRLRADITLGNVALSSVGTITNAHIIVDTAAEKKYRLTGVIEILMPGGSYATINVDSEVTQEGVIFHGTSSKSVPFGPFTVQDVVASYSVKGLVLQGNTTVEGYKTNVSITKEEIGIFSAEGRLAGLDKISPFQAIPGLSSLYLKDPKLKFTIDEAQVSIGIVGDVHIFGLMLQGELYTIKAAAGGDAIVILDISTSGGFKLSDAISALRGTPFAQIGMDGIHFVAASALYEDFKHGLDFEKGLNFYAFTDLSGPLKPVSDFTKIDAASRLAIFASLPQDINELVLKAHLPTGNVSLKTDKIKLGPLKLEFKGLPLPMLSLITSIIYTPQADKDPLIFSSRIGLGPMDALAAGTMQGQWTDVFGLRGFHLENVALQLGINYVLLATTGVPSVFGLAGTTDIGSKKLSFAANISLIQVDEMMFATSINEFSLADMAVIAAWSVGQRLNVDKIPGVKLEDVEIHLVPKTVKIGELSFYKGARVAGKLFLPGFSGFMRAVISESGIEMSGYCTPISWGPLEITRSDAEMKTCFDINDKTCIVDTKKKRIGSTRAIAEIEAKMHEASTKVKEMIDNVREIEDEFIHKSTEKNKDAMEKAQQELTEQQAALGKIQKELDQAYVETNGPIMRLKLSLLEQELLVSGKLSVADIFEQDTFVSLSNEGIKFECTSALGKTVYNGKPLLLAKIIGESSGSFKSPNFTLTIKFEQYLQEYLKEEVKKNFNIAAQTIERDINKAIKDVERIDQATAEASQAIDRAVKQVTSAKTSLEKIDEVRKMATKAIDDQRAEVERFQTAAAALEAEINRQKDSFDNMPWYEQVTYGWAKLGVELTGLGISLATVYASKEAAQVILTTLSSTIDVGLIAARESALGAVTASEQLLGSVTKNAALVALIGTKEIGKTVLEGARASALGTLQGGAFVFNNSLSLIDIQSITYKESLEEFAKGTLAHVVCEARFFGSSQIKIEFDLSVKKPFDYLAQATKNIVEKMISSLKSSSFIKSAQDLIHRSSETEASLDEVKKMLAASSQLNQQIAQLDAKLKDGALSPDAIKKILDQKESLIAAARKEAEERIKKEREKINTKISESKNRKNAEIAKIKAERGEKVGPPPPGSSVNVSGFVDLVKGTRK